ncbi:cell division protein DivIC [Ruminococcus sp. YE282]|nr:cell division protein DivIC [Ruminococcus bromii]
MENTELKEIKPEKKRFKLRYLILLLAVVGFMFYSVITIINQNVKIAEKKEQLKDLNQQINVVEINSKYLEKVQNYKDDELSAYMEKIAKDELGYVSDGERIFINVSGE